MAEPGPGMRDRLRAISFMLKTSQTMGDIVHGKGQSPFETVDDAISLLDEMNDALKPFAAFADKAEQFVAARAKDDGAPIMPTKDFRLADFKRARDAMGKYDG